MDSSVKYGQEIGVNLIKIVQRLVKNDELLMLLINTDIDPLNKETHPEKIDWKGVINKQIRYIPLVTPEDQTTTSKVVVMIDEGSISTFNNDNESLSLTINVYTPFKEWKIVGDNLRPYAIMSQIRQSLQDRKINGLGEIVYHGFSLNSLTEEMGCFSMRFGINAFS